MHFPTPQAVDSPTFKPGPLDGSLSVPHLLDLHLLQSPNHPVFIYDTSDGDTNTIRFVQYIQTVHQAARLVRQQVKDIGALTQPMVIGLLAISDTISYCMMMNAIIRAGYIPFAISPYNTAFGLAKLFLSTNTVCVYISPDTMMQSLASNAISLMDEHKLPVLAMPTFDQFQDSIGTHSILPPMETPCMDNTAVILHSSGSTSPVSKPIRLSHKTYLQWATLPWYGERDLCGEIMACHSVPIFHGMGTCLTCWPASFGLTVSCFRPTAPPIIPTPEAILNGATATNSTLIFCVPAFLEIWSNSVAGIDMLKSMKVVIWGGAPLKKSTGDKLTDLGVVLAQFYGTIETGCLSPYLPGGSMGSDWEYFTFSEHCRPLLAPQEDIPNLDVYELTLVDTPSHTPCFINTTVDGTPAYKLSDLLEKHPDNPNLWRVYGRLDDQIVLSTAANLNPVPIESYITKHPQVAFAVVFGHGQTHPGVILQLKKEFQFEPRDQTKFKEFIDSVWPVVEEANSKATPYSTILREMIIVASPNKPFEMTGKLQPRRPMVLQAYQQEIKAVYKATENYSEEMTAI